MAQKYFPTISYTRRVGLYNPDHWQNESGIQIKSSIFLREAAKNKDEKFKEALLKSKEEERRIDFHSVQYLFDKEAANKSSFLLLGYAIELILKAGVVKFCRGLPDPLIKNTLKKYSHRLEKMAIDLGLDLSGEEKKELVKMEQIIRTDGRYPISEEDSEKNVQKWSALNLKLNDDDYYRAILNLHERIFSIVDKLDKDSENPAFTWLYGLDQDGYITIRSGGGFPLRATVKYSSEQIKNNENTVHSLVEFIKTLESKHMGIKVLSTNWKYVKLYEHGEKDRPISRNQEVKKMIVL